MSAPTDSAAPAAAGNAEGAGAAGLEERLLPRLRCMAASPAARQLADDCAVLDWPLGLQLVATHDLLAEGVHFTPMCPPESVGWKLVAVNLSDLAAEAATPVAVLLGIALDPARPPVWAERLLAGVERALARFSVPLVGGDTIRSGATTLLSLTALGSVPAGGAIGRAGALAGDDLWLSGDIGAAGLGLAVALGQRPAADESFLRRYRWPVPRLALGRALRGLATAMLDVSDGLLLDAGRLAAASGLAAHLRSADVPLSAAVRRTAVPLAELASFGDDYELLFAAPPARSAAILAAGEAAHTPLTRIGSLAAGSGVYLDGERPGRLGFLHR